MTADLIQEAADDVEPQSGSLMPPCLRSVALTEHFEDRLAIVGANADAGIAHANHYSAVVDGDADTDAALLGKIERMATRSSSIPPQSNHHALHWAGVGPRWRLGPTLLRSAPMSQPDFRSMMTLEPHGADTFVASGPRYPWGGLYGGQIIAQALRAATLTVDPAYHLHSLHAYFIRLGDAAEPIRLEVDRIRNGRSFLTRRVVARQSGGAILNMSSSFQMPEDGPIIQTEEMPDVARADELQEDSWSPLFARRFLREDIAPGRIGAWLKLNEDLKADTVLNACGLAYLSDDLPCDAVVARHPKRAPRGSNERNFWPASLDHAIWFHHPMRANEWHLYDFMCRGLVGTRGVSIGSVFDARGKHVATVSQEVLIRTRRA